MAKRYLKPGQDHGSFIRLYSNQAETKFSMNPDDIEGTKFYQPQRVLHDGRAYVEVSTPRIEAAMEGVLE